ncbi:hypothetical protein TNCV_1165881 [Trichonephila clavipes]|uniref:Uncharacterized protein n=1 Tax=Trichonephila clavipes TaxID=2585209 RepID=A0A8X6VT79_TRICX|nr:hypothetical protein TNCV_1165881 [Trichonephila clavipes]
MDLTEINSRGKRGELLGRIDRQNSRFRTAKTTIIKFVLPASFVELESTKSALNEEAYNFPLDFVTLPLAKYFVAAANLFCLERDPQDNR